jgi:type I restriction enzyme S subunit
VYGGNGVIGYIDKYLYETRQVLVACRGAASGKFNQTVSRSFVTNNSLILESSRQSAIPFGYLKGVISAADLTPFVTGSAQPQVTIDNLKNFKFLIPPLEILKCYETFSSAFEDQLEANAECAESLSRIRDTLLPRLISGQLRIADAEAELEKVTA